MSAFDGQIETIDGHIEGVGGGRIRGWVWAPQTPDDPLIVTASRAGTILGAARADIYRPDLEAHGKRGGFCGFALPIDQDAAFLAHQGAEAGGGDGVEIAVQRLVKGELTRRTTWRTLTADEAAALGESADAGAAGAAKSAFGAMDRLDEVAIAGWCYASQAVHAEGPLVLDLLIDNVWADTTVAASPGWGEAIRGRLRGAPALPSRMRFRFRTPLWLKDGRAHAVTVAVKGADGAVIDRATNIRLPLAETDRGEGFALPPLVPVAAGVEPPADGPQRGEYERWIEAHETLPPPRAVAAEITLLVETRQGRRGDAALAATRESLGAQGITADLVAYGPRARQTLREAISATAGDYFALVTAGDRLADGALARLGAAAAGDPGAALLYSDDDRLDALGIRRRPRFKTAYCPDRALTDDLFSGLTLIRADAVRRALQTAPNVIDGASLALKVARAVGPSAIRHVPMVLAHRAMEEAAPLPGRTAFVAALLAAEAAAAEGPAPLVVDGADRRIVWPLPEARPSVAAIIPTRDGAALFEPLVTALLAQEGADRLAITIVDNRSEEKETFAAFGRLTADPRVRVMRVDEPFNFSRLNNLAVAASEGDILLFVNNDIAKPQPGLLDEMVRQAMRPDVGAVGARLAYADGTNQHCGVGLGIGGVGSHLLKGHADLGRADHGRFRHVQTMSAVTAALLAMRRDVFETVGGFDEALAVAYNDVDLCLKVGAAGYRVLYTPHAAAYHLESQSRGLDKSAEKRARLDAEKAVMIARWGARLLHDPAISPNHTLASRDLRPAIGARNVAAPADAAIAAAE
ncbi:glycosyltransferase family 2 protein [Acuticoccus kandeliae]|uniref:glycosyltransferase family 2 protein n=1 Tax=Acuticoccus kandeliae TaxID=2073160 RepID=UPI000D3E3646|nr:glycosyltransferase [Acuticoccus kandeliae]